MTAPAAVPTTATTALKAAVRASVDRNAAELRRVSHAIHESPELGYVEHRASTLLAGVAQRNGFRVRRGVADLPTAFVAVAGDQGPTVAVFCEYDALPGLGHACGHNIIAAAGLGAAIALQPLARRGFGTLLLVGSPAEEGGGGKVRMLDTGILEGVHAALLVHPNAYETACPRIVAAVQLAVSTHGRAAHASLFPERGINALDAMVLGYTGLWALRASLPPGARVHGVLLNGGQMPGVIPDRADASYLVRAPTVKALRPVTDRVVRLLRAGASGVGAELRIRVAGPVYREMRTDPFLALAWERNITALGRRPLRSVPSTLVGSSDMGNVSQLVPAIHPMIAISDGDVVPHTRPFASAAASARGDQAVLDGAKALAMTAIDVWAAGNSRSVTGEWSH